MGRWDNLKTGCTAKLPTLPLFDGYGPVQELPAPHPQATTGEVTLTLPLTVPSVNNYYTERIILSPGKGKTRLRCPCCHAPLSGFVNVAVGREGKRFRELVAYHVGERIPLAGRLSMTTEICFPDKRTRDLGNADKALSDALQHAGLFTDDGQIDHLEYDRGHVVKGGRLVVHVRTL